MKTLDLLQETLDVSKERLGFSSCRVLPVSCRGGEGAASTLGRREDGAGGNTESQDRGGGSINFRESVIDFL
jgi:hypothetical protein